MNCCERSDDSLAAKSAACCSLTGAASDVTTCFTDSGSEFPASSEDSPCSRLEAAQETSPDATARGQRSASGNFSSAADVCSVLQETVRLSHSLDIERSKVDTLQNFLVQREAQKEVFFLQSLKKESECLALREELLALQSDFDAKQRAHEAQVTAQQTELTAWQERADQLAAEKANLQQFSDMLESHAEQLRQSVAELEDEKLSLMKKAMETQKAGKQSEPQTAPPVAEPIAQTEVVPPALPPPPQEPEAKLRLPRYCTVLLACALLLYGLSLILRSHQVVL